MASYIVHVVVKVRRMRHAETLSQTLGPVVIQYKPEENEQDVCESLRKKIAETIGGEPYRP